MTQPLQPPPDFLSALSALGIELEPGEPEKLGHYLALLLEANKTTNLTAITDPAAAWKRHILDALTLLPVLSELPEGAAVIDVGSGGGVPGLPLAVTMPHLRFTLLEPTGKKSAFLGQAVAELGLANVTVLNKRAEQVGQDKANHREKYDAVISRAVGALNVVAELMIPLCRQGGVIAAIKGAKAEAEVAHANGAMVRVAEGDGIIRTGFSAIGALGARLVEIRETPTGKIVILEKASKTPNLYPRRDGEPKHNPLGGVFDASAKSEE
ncbi:MAG TPA: 16S rRNA (guanine(527)-N(7))-methyltransferase RsmG [Phycisphaerales bacterium]|nr:16S rRNA (guanine(527)-N(7))-methyltransferase RsmG [Phycisphaerales bacterium]